MAKTTFSWNDRDFETALAEAIAPQMEQLKQDVQRELDVITRECEGMPAEAIEGRLRRTFADSGLTPDSDTRFSEWAEHISSGQTIEVVLG